MPDRTVLVKGDEGRTREYWIYTRNIPTSGGVTVNLPLVGGGVSLSGARDCRAAFELVEGRVTRIGTVARRTAAPQPMPPARR